jgi:hypothetical protein
VSKAPSCPSSHVPPASRASALAACLRAFLAALRAARSSASGECARRSCTACCRCGGSAGPSGAVRRGGAAVGGSASPAPAETGRKGPASSWRAPTPPRPRARRADRKRSTSTSLAPVPASPAISRSRWSSCWQRAPTLPPRCSTRAGAAARCRSRRLAAHRRRRVSASWAVRDARARARRGRKRARTQHAQRTLRHAQQGAHCEVRVGPRARRRRALHVRQHAALWCARSSEDTSLSIRACSQANTAALARGQLLRCAVVDAPRTASARAAASARSACAACASS